LPENGAILLEIDAMVMTDLLKRALSCSEAAVCWQIRAKVAMNRVETDRPLILILFCRKDFR
jgi:hypothetical protein